MQRILGVFAVLVGILVVLPLRAADQPGKPAAPSNPAAPSKPAPPPDPYFQFPKGTTPTESQKAGMEAIKKEYSAKIHAAVGALEAIPTSEQSFAGLRAKRAAVVAGKNAQEARAAEEAAMKLSPEQKQKYHAAVKEVDALQAAIDQKIAALLKPASPPGGGIRKPSAQAR